MSRMLTALGLVLALASPVAHAPAAQAADRDEVEAIVRELLAQEPELVIEAIRTFQAREEAARLAAAQQAIDDHRADLISTEHPSVGPLDAAVTVIEFFDYRCGYCRRMLEPLATLRADQQDVRVVYVDFPVLGPDSLRAAQAGLAAWKQDGSAYMPFHEALMTANDLSAPAIQGLAAAHGLDPERLIDDMQSPEIRRRLEANYAIAQAIGIEGTPAFIIGDVLLPGAVPLQRLEQVIDEVRADS